jgi:hypothetical protein
MSRASVGNAARRGRRAASSIIGDTIVLPILGMRWRLPEPPKLRMTLLDNAYDFLNTSLEVAEAAESEPTAWKQAILGIVQAIELLLKERLRREHPLFIYSDIDKSTLSVGLGLAVARLQRLGVGFDQSSIRAIEQAKKWRDLMIHYEFDLFVHEVRDTYSLLFEFMHFFHRAHFDGELHDHIRQDLWLEEAALMKVFKERFVEYRGARMVSYWPEMIQAAQFVTWFRFADGALDRIRYGDEQRYLDVDPTYSPTDPCHDCGVLPGELHTAGCDWEECPRCRAQFLSCGCEPVEWEGESVESLNDAAGTPKESSDGATDS